MANAWRVAIVYRGEPQARDARSFEQTRLAPIAQALRESGIAAEPVVYADEIADEVRTRLLSVDGVLVWVDPIANGEDRTKLDALLRHVASQGTWVSAHPDVVMKIGTKEVLYATRELGWGGDTHLYRSLAAFRDEFPRRLAQAGPRVLKQLRGNGGIGVWKVVLQGAVAAGPTMLSDEAPGPSALVRVQHAQMRDTASEELTLGDFMERCAAYLPTGGNVGALIDQAFQPRITEGLVRCYLVKDEIVGFARQYPNGFSLAEPAQVDAAGRAEVPKPDLIFGLPAAKTMYAAHEPALQALRTHLETEWLPGLETLTGLRLAELPALWDADFLLGARTASGDDTYVLCEINVSSVIPFPERSPQKIAEVVSAALEAKGRRW